jgi:hypothetical protein
MPRIADALKLLVVVLPSVATLFEQKFEWFAINPMLRRGLTPIIVVLSIVAFFVIRLTAGSRKGLVAYLSLGLALMSVFAVMALTSTDLADRAYAPFAVQATYVLVFVALGAAMGAAGAGTALRPLELNEPTPPPPPSPPTAGTRS